jgi:hypothetical protein
MSKGAGTSTPIPLPPRQITTGGSGNRYQSQFSTHLQSAGSMHNHHRRIKSTFTESNVSKSMLACQDGESNADLKNLKIGGDDLMGDALKSKKLHLERNNNYHTGGSIGGSYIFNGSIIGGESSYHPSKILTSPIIKGGHALPVANTP